MKQVDPQRPPEDSVAMTVPPSSMDAQEQSVTRASRRGLVGRGRDTGREMVAFARCHRLWTVCMIVFVLAWTIELYALQAITLVYPNDTSAKFAFWAPKIRLALDLLFVLSLTFWLRRRWLIIIVFASFFINLGLFTYFQYFKTPLSLLTILFNWREGLQVTGLGLDMFPRRGAAILAAGLLVQLVALVLSRNKTLPRRCAILVASLSTLAYLGLYQVTNFLDPLEFIQTTRGVGRLGVIRGYLGPWLAEWHYLYRNNDHILQRALELRMVSLHGYDRLSALEAPIPIEKHLVILQAESLDFNILGYRVGNQEVTPFLNRLRDLGMFYRVRAMHDLGSSDADFAALTGCRGSDHQNSYQISGYPYEDTTVQVLTACGYDVYSFHGNSGQFYSRRQAFERMGFSGIFFREELEGRFLLPAQRWGVTDRDVLAFSAKMLREAKRPTCHFIITLTTHVPYDMLDLSDMEIHKHPRDLGERYINNMRYLDNCLRDYLAALGSGTTVMIYADHPTEEGNGDFFPDRDGARQFIPCFIYDSDEDLSKLQRTRTDPRAKDGSWNLVDVVRYLRTQVKRNCQPRAEVIEQPAP